MNCYQHPDAAAAAYCRSCGRPVCNVCERTANGTVFCPEHVPLGAYSAPRADSAPNPYIQPVKPIETSPGLAFLLGLIPGVGAIYNAQYLKGFIHVAILGVLISILSSGRLAANEALQPFFGLLIGIWYFYMPFEAYHTARKRQLGVAVDEWSSLLPRNSASGGSSVPLGPVILIGIGVYSLYFRLSGPIPAPPPQAPPPPRSSSEAMGVSNEH